MVSAVVSLFFSISAAAQNYNLTVSLEDKDTGEPVGFATVSVTPEGKTKATKYSLSDSHGKARIEGIKAGKYTIKAELLGYKAFEQEINVSKTADLGIFKMEQDKEVLDAANISAVGNPIVIKKDTVEYNASSFKTTENDALEELLKKLPGVEINEDGSITANGETISKITIDGKTFFLDDPQLATKNLPAKIVDKVKVVKKKSEQAEFTGIDDGQEEYVIDLQVKKGMMNGLFGNVMLGGGHDVPSSQAATSDYRYQGAGMIGKFTDKTQISLILNGNNTNNRGFNDLSGSMMQGMRGGGMGRGGGGWGNGNGITTSWMGGLNGAWTLFDGKMDLGGNYLYNNTSRLVEEESYKEVYKEGQTTIYQNSGFNDTWSDGHRMGFRLDHKFSDNTSLLIQPQIDFGRGRYTEFSDFATYNNALTNKATDGFSFTNGNNNNVTTRGFALFRQRLGIPGRTLSLMTNWNFSNNSIEGLNQSVTYNYLTDIDPALVNQRYDQQTTNRSISGRLVYTEPIGNNFYLEGHYGYSWRRNNSWKDTYDSGAITGDFNKDIHEYNRTGEVYSEVYSNSIDNRSTSHSPGFDIAYQEGKTRAQIGLSANITSTYNKTLDGKTEKEYEDPNRFNWAPQAMVFYDINDNSSLRLFYRGSSSQPSTSQLMAVMDNSNPLSLSFGNPSLYPYFRHNLRSEFSYTNKQTFFSFRGTLEGGMVQDPIVNAVWYDESNVRYSMPVNGDNTYNGSFRMFLNSPIAKSNFSVSLMSRTSYTQSNNFTSEGRFDMSKFYNEDGSIMYDDFVSEFSNIREKEGFIHNTTRSLSMMDRLRLTYRNDHIEVTASARTRFSKPWYTIATASENATWANQLQSTLNWTPGQIGLTMKADVDYNWYRGYTTPRDDEFIINAEISQLLFKKQFTLALKVYDLLNQAKNLSVTDTDDYHQEVYNNTLGRYVILSLTWRFGTFGGRNGGRRGMGGPPMGGPVGGRGGR